MTEVKVGSKLSLTATVTGLHADGGVEARINGCYFYLTLAQAQAARRIDDALPQPCERRDFTEEHA